MFHRLISLFYCITQHLPSSALLKIMNITSRGEEQKNKKQKSDTKLCNYTFEVWIVLYLCCPVPNMLLGNRTCFPPTLSLGEDVHPRRSVLRHVDARPSAHRTSLIHQHCTRSVQSSCVSNLARSPKREVTQHPLRLPTRAPRCSSAVWFQQFTRATPNLCS